MCHHNKTHQVAGSRRCFDGPVAVPPYTDENPAAHGNVCVTEECERCGAQRDVNINQRHVEYSTWGQPRRT